MVQTALASSQTLASHAGQVFGLTVARGHFGL
jgi:hypothetical protein